MPGACVTCGLDHGPATFVEVEVHIDGRPARKELELGPPPPVAGTAESIGRACAPVGR